MSLPTIKPPTKAQIEAANQHKHEKEIRQDLNKISTAIQNNAPQELISLHKYIDGKYQYCIADWGKSMWGYAEGMGFAYDALDSESIKENLNMMRPKLEAFMRGWNVKSNSTGYSKSSDVTVTVNNTNNINITLSVEEAKQKIEDMPGLTDAETEEIKGKIDELDTISKEDISKKKKWERVKPIIKFALDKSADVAITIMGLILQMKLGM